jgi:GT2 family glycosyltransferase
MTKPKPRAIESHQVDDLGHVDEATRLIDEQRHEIAELRQRLTALEGNGADSSRLELLLSEAHSRIAEMESVLRLRAAQSAYFNVLRGTATYRLITKLQKAGHAVAPLATRRGRAAHAAARAAAILVESGPIELVRVARSGARHRGVMEFGPADLNAEYRRWLTAHEPDAQRLDSMRADGGSWVSAPTISVIMPVFDPDSHWLEEAIESVRAQAYEKWQLCIADDASTRPHVREIVLRCQAADSRITSVFRDRNGGIAEASNSALALAKGDYVALLDHDDVLRPHALYRVAEHLRSHERTDIVYSDEDKILPDGKRGDVFFKPDWSPEWLLSQNYMCHLAVLRRSLVEEIGGFRAGFEGSQDHDLLLRASERARDVGHVPDVLYSWRQVPGSAALSPDAKPEARQAGRRAVADALRRRAKSATVQHSPIAGVYDVRFEVQDTPKVAIVIPTRDGVELLRRCVASIEEKSTYAGYQIVVVDNDSRDPRTHEYLNGFGHRVVRMPGPFNYSRLINQGVRSGDAPFVLLLNNDAIMRTPDAVEQLLGLCLQPEIAAVGCRLNYPNGQLQHCGVGIGDGRLAFNLHVDWPGMRNVSAVTGACMMIRRKTFEELGGFDESFAVAFNDVDFCLRARRAGYRVAYTPNAQFEHVEGASRGHVHPSEDAESFRRRWGGEDQLRDPYLSPNLTFQHDDRAHVVP